VAFQFSDIELEKLHTAWLAWKDIESHEFLEGFRRLWNLTIKEVESLLERCNYKRRLQEVGRVGLTLQPNTSFNFSSIDKAYIIHAWRFFFCHDPIESSAYFRPAFEVAYQLVHEYAHFKFCREHKILEKDLEVTKHFKIEQGLNDETYAHTEEEKFLKKLQFNVPNLFDIKLFRVRSWTNNGFPECIGKRTHIWARKGIKEQFKSVRESKRNLKKSYTVKSYDRRMSREKTKVHNILSSILKLGDGKKHSKIVWMDLF